MKEDRQTQVFLKKMKVELFEEKRHVQIYFSCQAENLSYLSCSTHTLMSIKSFYFYNF